MWAQYAKNESGSPAAQRRADLCHHPGVELGGAARMVSTQRRHRLWPPTSPTPRVPSEPCRRTTPPTRGSRGPTRPRRLPQVQNASGKFTLPTPVDVASALAYATQQSRRDPQAQLQRIGSQRLQPVDLQLPADADHRVGHRQGGHDEPVRELRADPRPAGGTEIRIRQSGPVARALRHRPGHRQCPRRSRPDRGRERRLRVRRPDTDRGPGRPDDSHLWRDQRDSSAATARRSQRRHRQRQHGRGQAALPPSSAGQYCGERRERRRAGAGGVDPSRLARRILRPGRDRKRPSAAGASSASCCWPPD